MKKGEVDNYHAMDLEPNIPLCIPTSGVSISSFLFHGAKNIAAWKRFSVTMPFRPTFL